MFRFILSSVLLAGAASTVPALSPLALERVFIPAHGYDDNDVVEAVLSGELPNPCFSLQQSKIDRVGETRFRITTEAVVRRTGACASGSSIDDPTPFQQTVTLGTLPRGTYTIEFTGPGGKTVERQFEVEVARSPEIDEWDYALVRKVAAEDIYATSKTIRVTLSAQTTQSCHSVPNDFTVRRENDVILILPTLDTIPGTACQRQVRNFQKTVTLPKLEAGSYLLQVRSRNGQAVNHQFDVLDLPKQ